MFQQCANRGFNTNIFTRCVYPVVANTVLTTMVSETVVAFLLRTQSLPPMVPETAVSETVISITAIVFPHRLPIRTHVGATLNSKLGHRTYQQFRCLM